MCRRLVDLLFRALWDNNHSGLLDDAWLACLLWVTNLLNALLPVQLVKKVDVHNENYPGNVTEPQPKQKGYHVGLVCLVHILVRLSIVDGA